MNLVAPPLESLDLPPRHTPQHAVEDEGHERIGNPNLHLEVDAAGAGDAVVVVATTIIVVDRSGRICGLRSLGVSIAVVVVFLLPRERQNPPAPERIERRAPYALRLHRPSGGPRPSTHRGGVVGVDVVVVVGGGGGPRPHAGDVPFLQARQSRYRHRRQYSHPQDRVVHRPALGGPQYPRLAAVREEIPVLVDVVDYAVQVLGVHPAEGGAVRVTVSRRRSTRLRRVFVGGRRAAAAGDAPSCMMSTTTTIAMMGGGRREGEDRGMRRSREDTGGGDGGGGDGGGGGGGVRSMA